MTIELSNSKKTYLGAANGRKRWALDCSIGAIQFREDGGEWQAIDPSIEAIDSDGFNVKFTQVPYLGRIASDSRRRIYPDRTNLDCWIQFDKPFPNMPAPSRSNRWFYWDFPNALMGVGFDNASIKFGFRLKNSNAPTSITIPFTTQGITRQGRLLYHNGEVMGELRKPFATDANEEERECGISFGEGEVTISLDTTGLTFPIDIDPTLDLDVGANLNDVSEKENTGVVGDYTTVQHNAYTSSDYRDWGAHRWVSAGLPVQGDTIDVAYIQLYTSGTKDDINGNLHFQKAASPAQFVTDDNNVTDRPRTSDSVSWVKDSCGAGWENSPSLVDPLQEVVDAYSPTAIVLIFRPNQDSYKEFYSTAHNSDPSRAANLHIEWTAGAEHYERSYTALLGLLPTASRPFALGRDDTALLGLKPTISKVIDMARSDIALLGLKPTASRAIALVKAKTILLGLKGIGSRPITYVAKTGTALLGLKTTATRTLALTRTKTALLGLKATGSMSTLGHYVKEGVVYLGLKTTAIRTLSLTRMQTAYLGLKTIAISSWGITGRKLRLIIVTTQNRKLNVITSLYRKIRILTGV